ncbi:MAG: inositol monophosphatase [Zetaproteobacteria bacterium CG12_big_fil_rev_8_21_14_0_65_54_13]|nr:MAG: inositol monophosphatase [Zetaproteobacteria bacterium CG23_combo_of_CG06-09_8_20_14_all_54_7]PIW46674.1 MAG: inositol monophosphatase [Zetaproteobacteria bacterium CG12_big_fil_rev_8_21_14_0_65_54_13]
MAVIHMQDLIDILEQTGRDIIMPAFAQAVQSETKSDGSLVTTTDLACQAYIQQRLQQLDASIAMLGEEMSEHDQLSLLTGHTGAIWCLDPLDGTTNFTTSLPCFALSLALIRQGKPVMACIHDPVRQETFAAEPELGACLNGQAIHAAGATALSDTVGFIDSKRLPAAIATAFACKPFYRSQRNIGSCALEWAWLAAGRAQFIIHGNEKIWDFAAGSLIAAEAGCIVSDFAGRPFFPTTRLSSPVLAACNSELHTQVKHLLIQAKQEI